MQSIIKYIVGKTYKPLLVKYLSTSRTWSYKGIMLEIPPQVFHPRFFFSSKILFKYISRLSLEGRSFLELGAGSGLIAIRAAQMGADVTAIDINPIAVTTLKTNQVLNKTDFTVIQSDLFESIPLKKFDVIAINPPFYKRDPELPADHAWFCGTEGQYYLKLFSGMDPYIHSHSKVFMILSDNCDMNMIRSIAGGKGFRLVTLEKHRNLMENNFIYSIEKVSW